MLELGKHGADQACEQEASVLALAKDIRFQRLAGKTKEGTDRPLAFLEGSLAGRSMFLV